MSFRSYVNRHMRAFEQPFEAYNHITVSRSAILHNFDLFQGIVPDGFVIPVLKSNAYGHGLEEIATILKARKFPYIAVDGYFEGLRIHNVSKQPVLVMGAIAPSNFARMPFKNFAFVVHDRGTVKALAATGKRINVHMGLETGMGRHGVTAQELPSFLNLLKQYPRLRLEGVMTHLADADNPSDTSYTERQVELFDALVEKVRAAGLDPKYLHIAQSAGSTKAHSKHANALRVGIALYGITPLEPRDPAQKLLKGLRPALTLTTTIAKVLTVPKGGSVGYGRTFTAKRDSQIGVLPIGYYEGLPRALSNVGVVQYKGTYLPIAGRVCMNHTMVDCSGTNVRAGDTVMVFSADKNARNSINAICQAHNLFNYGLLVGLNQNIHRSVID